jgi:hypothetical protein
MVALIRPFDPGRDLKSVLTLANADRIPGQPLVTSAALAEAQSGRSPIDQNWWDDLVDISIEVAVNDTDDVVGVVSWASRPRDDAGILLWLHAREARDVIDSLVAHTLDRLRGRSHYQAFEFATALGRGLEALPVRHRRQTHLALLDHNFSGTPYWRYLSCSIADRPPAPPLDPSLDLSLERDISQRLTLTRAGEPVAEVEFDDAIEGLRTCSGSRSRLNIVAGESAGSLLSRVWTSSAGRAPVRSSCTLMTTTLPNGTDGRRSLFTAASDSPRWTSCSPTLEESSRAAEMGWTPGE